MTFTIYISILVREKKEWKTNSVVSPMIIRLLNFVQQSTSVCIVSIGPNVNNIKKSFVQQSTSVSLKP